MEINDALAAQLDSIDTSALPKPDRMLLVGFENRENDDKVTFDATKPRMCKLFHSVSDSYAADMHPNCLSNQIKAHSIRFNNFKVGGDGRLAFRGSFHQIDRHNFRCPTCKLEIEYAFLDEKRAKAANKFHCDKCGPEAGKLEFAGVVEPYMPAFGTSPVLQAMLAVLKSTDFSKSVQESCDVLPQVMCVYNGTAPGIWTPSTPLEEEASTRLAAKGKHMVPFRLSEKVTAPIAGIVCLARPFSAGWVSSRYFYRPAEPPAELDRFNPGYKAAWPRRILPNRRRRPDVTV